LTNICLLTDLLDSNRSNYLFYSCLYASLIVSLLFVQPIKSQKTEGHGGSVMWRKFTFRPISWRFLLGEPLKIFQPQRTGVSEEMSISLENAYQTPSICVALFTYSLPLLI